MTDESANSKGGHHPVRQEDTGLLSPQHPPETTDEADGGSDRDRSLQEDRPPHHDR